MYRGYLYTDDKELLKEHHEGIICLSGCMGGEISRALAQGATERAARTGFPPAR